MESLRADYTEVWCAGQNVALARFADGAGSIVASGLDRLGLTFADDVVDRLRGFDDVVSWYGANRPEFRDVVAGLGLPVRFCEALPKGCHGVEFYNRQAAALGGCGAGRLPRLAVPKVRRTFAALHPFASSVAKRAPMAWFEGVASRLEQAMPVRWFAGPEEVLAGAERIDDLWELACVLAGAKVYVGNDSGISHLAAAVGTPVLAVFRDSDSRTWAPRGIATVQKFS